MWNKCKKEKHWKWCKTHVISNKTNPKLARAPACPFEGFIRCFVTLIKKNNFVRRRLSLRFSRGAEVARACPCQRFERRWKQPTVTMCSCISNFLWRAEKWEGRKRKVLRERSERDRWRERRTVSNQSVTNKKRCNWTVISFFFLFSVRSPLNVFESVRQH